MTESKPQEPKESRERRSSRRFVVPGLIAAAAIGALSYIGVSNGGGEQEHKPVTPSAAAPSPEAQERAGKFPDVIKKGDKLKCIKGVAVIDNPDPVDMEDNVRLVLNPVVAKKGGKVFVSAGTPDSEIPPEDIPMGMTPLKETDTLIVSDPNQPVTDCTYTDRQEVFIGDDPTTPERRYAPATSPNAAPMALDASLLNKGVFAVQLPREWGTNTDLSNPGNDGTTWVQDLGLNPASKAAPAKVAEALPETA